MLLVSVSQSSRKKRERDEEEEERKLWASLQEAKGIFDDDSAKNTILRKSEKRERKNISVILKIRSKSSALFISFRLGAEKTSEHDDTCTQSALLFTTFVPSPFTYSEKQNQRRDYRLLSRV